MVGVPRVTAVLVAAVVLGVAACDEPSEAPPRPAPAIDPGWSPVVLPGADGAERLAVRAATTCANRWYLVGGAVAADGAARPMAWQSRDGRSWSPLPVRADSFYGRRAVLYAVSCRADQLVALGARAGGVHGNPRVSGWRLVADGALTEVPAPFELFGGPTAANVARVLAGPSGWLIVGNRISGAAVWRAADPGGFEIVEAAPELASDGRGRTWALDAVADADGGWLLVGGIGRAGRVERDPLAWASADGRDWRRQEVPAAVGYDELQRVILVNGHPLAVGRHGSTFGVWRNDGTGWTTVGRFGRIGSAGPASVAGLVAVGGQVHAVVSDGASHRLWVSADGGAAWRELAGPVPAPPAGGDRAVVLAADEQRLLLAVDDGASTRAWTTPAPVPLR